MHGDETAAHRRASLAATVLPTPRAEDFPDQLESLVWDTVVTHRDWYY
jgi:hypothetical protein